MSIFWYSSYATLTCDYDNPYLIVSTMTTFKLCNRSHHTLRVRLLSGVPYELPCVTTLEDGQTWTLKAKEDTVVVEVKMKYGAAKFVASAFGAGMLVSANLAANLHGMPVTDGYEQGQKLWDDRTSESVSIRSLTADSETRDIF